MEYCPPNQARSDLGSFHKTPSSPRPCLLVYSVLYDNINQTALSPTSRNHPYKKCNNMPSIFNNAGTRGACGMCCVAYDNDNLHSSLKSPDPRLQYLFMWFTLTSIPNYRTFQVFAPRMCPSVEVCCELVQSLRGWHILNS